MPQPQPCRGDQHCSGPLFQARHISPSWWHFLTLGDFPKVHHFVAVALLCINKHDKCNNPWTVGANNTRQADIVGNKSKKEKVFSDLYMEV